MSSRLAVRLVLPIAALVTGAFGLYYVWWGVIAVRRGSPTFALLYGLFGLGGVVLGLALWRTSRQLRRPPA
jgi:hypothetical protein